MQRTNGVGHIDHLFVEEDINANQPPTQLTAVWFNAVQEELCSIVEAAGLTLDSNNSAQVLTAINELIVSVGNGKFIPHGAAIPDNADLNTYSTDGFYHQTSNIYAQNGSNYPISESGMLEVFADNAIVYQRYTTRAAPQKCYIRAKSSSVWTSWLRGLSTNDSAGFMQSSKSSATQLKHTTFYDVNSATYADITDFEVQVTVTNAPVTFEVQAVIQAFFNNAAYPSYFRCLLNGGEHIDTVVDVKTTDFIDLSPSVFSMANNPHLIGIGTLGLNGTYTFKIQGCNSSFAPTQNVKINASNDYQNAADPNANSTMIVKTF